MKVTEKRVEFWLPLMLYKAALRRAKKDKDSFAAVVRAALTMYLEVGRDAK